MTKDMCKEMLSTKCDDEENDSNNSHSLFEDSYDFDKDPPFGKCELYI